MKILRVHVIAADTCGGLLDGLDLWLRGPLDESQDFTPYCLIGPNGAGKSQFLQVLAEIFQSTFYAVVPEEERLEGNPDLQFELEYLIRPEAADTDAHVRVLRQAKGNRRGNVEILKAVDGQWIACDLSDPGIRSLLPRKVVGYTSGDNETLSLPFLLSRSGYAREVGDRALRDAPEDQFVADTRLMLIDYATHLEVLVANLLLGSDDERSALLADARLSRLNSFRCVVQLNHSAAPKVRARRADGRIRNGIQLTDELEHYLDSLKRCATSYNYVEKTETYIFDYLVSDATREAFNYFWQSAFDLYSALHKLSMLNDLAIPKTTRERLKRETRTRRFASRLPEPQDEDKVFRFERVNFLSGNITDTVDYVSLSDGEHQLTQVLGTFSMASFANVVFLLDEPESHFNPQWRVKFISRLLSLPTPFGIRTEKSDASRQECLLTTHAPFVPSDMSREHVLIFSKNDETGTVEVRRPDIETYGTRFDAILEECFGVRPPISEVSLREIDELMDSTDVKELEAGLERLGESVEKLFVADRLRQLTREQ